MPSVPANCEAGDQVEQAAHPPVAEVLGVRGVRVEGFLDVLPVHRRTDADPGVETAAGQDVHGGQVLGQAQRVLPAERGDGGAQLDAPGALGGGGQDGHR
jgi:hypothetical protein